MIHFLVSKEMSLCFKYLLEENFFSELNQNILI